MARWVVVAMIVVAFVYKTLNLVETGQGTSLMFVGVPALLAIIMIYAPTTSTTGTILKALTLMLLLAAMLAVEAAGCIIIAAPLVYGVGIGTGKAVDWIRDGEGQRQKFRVSVLAPLVLVTTLGEGPGMIGDRNIEAAATKTVQMTPEEVSQAVLQPPSYDRDIPAFFRYGKFPRPLSCRLVDDRLVIDFEDVEPRYHKMSRRKPGPTQLVLRVAEATPHRVAFVPVSDTTIISHWTDLESSVVEWAPVSGGTRVTWTIRAHRKIDPFWYFGPLQTYAAQRAAYYLLSVTVG